MLRAVVFDFFGTLTTPIPAERHQTHLAPVAAALGCDPVAFHDAWTDSFYSRATGEWGHPEAALRRALHHLDLRLDDDAVARALEIRRSRFAAYVDLRDDAVPTLAKLRRRGLRTAVLSDCTDDLPTLWPQLAVAPLVDATVFSYEQGCHKPDPRLYAEAARRLEVEPGECLYVGDGGSDELAGAERAGMRAVRIAADGHLGYGHVEWPGPVVDHLAALLEFVPARVTA